MLAVLNWLGTLAQEVNVEPSSDGLPGGVTIQQLLNWAGMLALWASVAAMLAGGGLYAWSRGGGPMRAGVTGSYLALGGGVGALLVGLGPTIVNALYRIT